MLLVRKLEGHPTYTDLLQLFCCWDLSHPVVAVAQKTNEQMKHLVVGVVRHILVTKHYFCLEVNALIIIDIYVPSLLVAGQSSLAQ